MAKHSRALTFLILVVILASMTVVASRAADDEKGILSDLISRALSTPTSRVSIGDIQGALSSDAVIRDIQISDRDGVWLKLDRARIVWRRLALLQRRLEIDTLEIAHLDIVRRPIPAQAPVAGENQPLLPELPVRVEIKSFSLEELKVGEPLLGAAARLSASGAARLGPPTEGLDFRLEARRLDQSGTLTARLGFIPDTAHLDLTALLDEPQGGILARAGAIPGAPAVTLDLRGQGTLDDFAAQLTFRAGSDIGATGSADLKREGTARRLSLDLSATIAALLPEIAAPVFGGTTRLQGSASFKDDGSVVVPGIAVTAAAARLDLTGTLSADRIADLHVSASNLPTRDSRTVIAFAEIRRLAFDGRLTGALAAPSVDASLSADNVRLPTGQLRELDATIKAIPSATGPGGATIIQLSGNARATGLSLTDPSLNKAVGNEASLVLRGTRTTDGLVSFETLELKSPTIQGRFTGRAGSSEVDGHVDLEAPDLTRFGDVAGLALRGAASLTGHVEGTPRANRYTARIGGHATRFAVGIAPADGLFAGKLDVAGGVRLEPDGSFGFDRFTATGAHAVLTVDGMATPSRSDIQAELAIPNLADADKRLTGRGEVNARLTGNLDRPDAAARLLMSNGSALGRSVPRLLIEVVAPDIRGALNARLTLDGDVNGKPANGSLQIERPRTGGTSVRDINVVIGSVSARGAVALNSDNIGTGNLSLNAGNLDDISPLVLQKLAGQLEAEIALATASGGQDARVNARGRRLIGYGAIVNGLDADLALTDIYRHPIISGNVVVDRATIAGEDISRIELVAKGTPQASDITLTAKARGFGLDARAGVIPGDHTRIDLQKFTATRGGQRLALAGPAKLTLIDDGIDIAGFAVAFGRGRITLAGKAGSVLDLRVDARAVPLSTADVFLPGVALSGILDGTAELSGPVSAPSGTYQVRVSKFAARQIRDAGLPPIDASASGELSGSRATIDATVGLGGAGSLKINGSAPLGDGLLDLAVKGSVDAGLANRRLGFGGRRVTGKVAIDARIGGTVDQPQASGVASLSGATYSDAALGVRFNDIRARLVARGREVEIVDVSASTRNGGQINAAGRIELDAAGGFPGTVRVTGRRAQVIQTAVATAILDLDVNVEGPLARAPRAAGRINVVSLDVAVPERLPTTLQPLPGTRHVHPTRTAEARLALDLAAARNRSATPAFDAALDLTIAAAGHIVVHGRGLDAELGGNLRLTGTLAKPVPVGAFSLRQGRLEILTARLDLARGNLTFAGDLTPELDLQATTQSGGASLAIAVTGPASDPQFAFTSSPDLPEDEVLSRLLFGTASGQLSTGQALALAQAAAQYSGGSGAFEELRKSLGLAGVDINLGATGGPAVGLSRALNSRVSVGVRAGAGAGQTAVGVDVNIGKGFKIQGEAGAQGAVSVGIGAEREW